MENAILDYRAVWSRCLDVIKDNVDANAFITWFEPIVPAGLKKDGTLGEVLESQSVTVKSNNYRFELRCEETNQPYPEGEERPIGLFVKENAKNDLYQVLMPSDDSYKRIKEYLYLETNDKKGRKDLMRRHIADVEAIHALYPELII